jgi:hypothetical protein
MTGTGRGFEGQEEGAEERDLTPSGLLTRRCNFEGVDSIAQ